MKTALTLIASTLVALVGVLGQFLISRRNHIPLIREERALAYSGFLGACLTGIYAVYTEMELLFHWDNESEHFRPEDENQMREHISQSLMAYNSQMNQHLARLQIIAPLEFATLGRKIITEIALVHSEKSSRANLDRAYEEFAARAHEDLKSLRDQANSFRSMFRGIKELPSREVIQR